MPQDTRHRPRLWFECLVVLALAWLPHMAGSLTVFLGGSGTEASIAKSAEMAKSHYENPILTELGTTVASLQVILPLLYIMWRSSEGWHSFGLGRIRPIQHTAWALAAAIAGYAFYFVLAWGCAVMAMIFAPPHSIMDTGIVQAMIERPQHPSPLIAILAALVTLLALILNSFAEEFAMRSVLMTRIIRLTGSAVSGVLISTLIFASYHVYQGVYGVVSAFSFGLSYALVFAHTKSIWPAVIAHTLINILVFFTA